MSTRIVVLDDQQYLRDIIAAILDDAGYPTVAVATPKEAQQRMEELRPELLILDLSLPGYSGLQFLEQLRADEAWRDLPVVVVSGDPGKLLAVEGRENVVALTKPFDVTALINEIQRLLGPPVLTQTA
jgi:two-component system, OmpR family, phosphate regulon response regulator PhoB